MERIWLLGGAAGAAQMCQLCPAVCSWRRRITRFASICSGKRGGVAANTHRRGAEGAVPAAGAARSSGPSVQGVCLHTPRAVCYGIVAVGLSESGSGEVWRRRSLASVPPN